MSAQIFISYASRDRDVGQTICEALENRGFGCWISSRDIGPGENFQVSIVRAIRAARAMILVFSANSNNSDEVKKELVLAGQTHLVVIPVRVEDVTPDEAFAYEFATRQWIDLFGDWEYSIQRVVHQLTLLGIAPVVAPEAAVVEVPPAEPTTDASAPPPTTTERHRERSAPPVRAKTRGAVAIGGMVAVLAIAAGAWWSFSGPRARHPAPAVVPTPASNPAPSPVTNPAPAPAANPPPAATAIPATIAPPRASAAEAVQRGKAAFDRRDYAEGMQWFRKAADQGDTAAQVDLGLLYRDGAGGTRDYAEAMRWFRKAADQGNASAQIDVGWLYENGQGVAKDYAQAMTWFRKAADQGNAGAKYNIALLYANGLGVPKDYGEAMRWFREAADQGHAPAQMNIGLLYRNGWGVAQNYAEAMSWFRKAADHGNASVARNFAESMILFRKAADHGNFSAQYDIGLLYANGLGVPRDLDQARAWMQKAAAGGEGEARNWLAAERNRR